MASAAEGGGRTSVRRHLSALVVANLLVLLGVGIGGIVATIRAHDSVHYLTQRVEPVARNNAAMLQVLTDAETYAWGYSISANPELLEQYRASVVRFHTLRHRLERAASLDPQVGLLVDDFMLAANTWFTSYAEPRVTGPVGVATYDAARFERGVRLFDEVQTTNAAVSTRLEELSRAADARADALVRRIVTLLAGLIIAAATFSVIMDRWVARRVTEPLGELEETAHRLATGEHRARAPATGPREVVQVATAINRMADENDRARAVEARVVEQLHALDAVKSDFVSNVSHELRTPLTSILGYLELLEEEVSTHAHHSETEMIEAAKRNVVRLGELIDDLLALTRSEAQRTELVPLDLALLARDVVTDLRVASSQQGVEIRLGFPGSPVPVLADSSQMARVLTNLVSNAVKFSPGGSEVTVTVVADGDDAVLSVEDHGIGIPESELNQLGSRFYRASNAVRRGITGTGLGLRIVQAIVENHHGNVDLRSTLDVGTTIWVRIPLAHADVPAATEMAEDLAENASVGEQQGPRSG
jgi:signal transduction histidine kinase